MTCAEFFGFARSPSQPRPLLAPPDEDRFDETCGTVSTRVLRKQSHVKGAAADTRGAGAVNRVSQSFLALYLVGLLNHVEQCEIYLSSREYREQRKLKRAVGIVKTQGTVDVSTIF